MSPPKALGRKSATKASKLGQMRGLSEAASALDAPPPPESGEIRNLQIDEIKLDANNPRRLNLDWASVQTPPDQIEDPVVRKEVEAIAGMAQSVRQHGQRSPVEVVRDGSAKRLVFGERRYWSVRLAGRQTIKANILHAEPENVPLIQLIENVHQRELPLFAAILNIRTVVEREGELGRPVKDAQDLIDRTGLTRSTAYRYWRYTQLPEDVDALLETRVLTTHEELAQILKHETVADRAAAVARYQAGGGLAKEVPASDGAASGQTRPKRAGRPATKISLGATTSSKVAEHIVHTLDPDGDYQSVDWEDKSQAAKVWKSVLAALEKRLIDDG